MKPNLGEAITSANPQRRTILRGALVTAIGFPLLAGCKPKEAANTNSSTATTPDAVPPASEAPPPTSSSPTNTDAGAPSGKMSKAQAQYQSQPKGDQQCSNCMHFLAESNACMVVEGPIEPQGWSILWAKRPS